MVNWGSFNHLKSILFLSEQALDDKRNGYFHLITGQDFPIKPTRYFFEELDTQKDYLEYFEMPEKRWPGNGGMDRLEYYLPYEIFDYKSIIGKIIIRTLEIMQKLIKLKRRVPYSAFHKLYGGSTY